MPLHVSSTVVLIIRVSKLYYTASGIVTHIQVAVRCTGSERTPLSTCARDGHLRSVTIPDAV